MLLGLQERQVLGLMVLGPQGPTGPQGASGAAGFTGVAGVDGLQVRPAQQRGLSYSETVGDGTTTSFDIIHNLDATDVAVTA